MDKLPKYKTVHLSIRGGNPIESGISDPPRLDRKIRSIYTVISERINKNIVDLHISMLSEAGTYSKRASDSQPESLEDSKMEELKQGIESYPDDLRLNTREAEYGAWEDRFKEMCLTFFRSGTENQGVHLTVDTWSLGTAFFVKFLSQQTNRRFLIENKIQIKGIHFIAPTVASGTSFAIDELSEDIKHSLREFLRECSQNIHVTGNKHDQILEGQAQEHAEQIAKILGISPYIEGHSQNDRLASHYVADTDVINHAVLTSIEMMQQAKK